MNLSKTSTVAVILAAGKGERAELGYNKMFYPLLPGKTLIECTVDAFRMPEIDAILLVTAADDMERMRGLFPDIEIIEGGATRTDSARNALNYLEAADCETVLIHDGARPFVSRELIRNVAAHARKDGCAIPGLRITETVKEVSGIYVRSTLLRSELYYVQTPQGFVFDKIRRAYNRSIGEFFDDGEVYERAGYISRIIPGQPLNTKVTVPEDLIRADTSRIGYGFDVHRLVAGRPLVVGGVHIPFDKGLDGHSDADVLVHAVIDAVLVSVGLPNIGQMFPDTDPAYKDANSLTLLKTAMDAITKAGYAIGSISGTVVGEAPKFNPYLRAMADNIAAVTGIHPDKVNFNATTTENLGATANEQGLAAHATALSYQRVIADWQNR